MNDSEWAVPKEEFDWRSELAELLKRGSVRTGSQQRFNILGMGGKLRSGKDTAADFLVEDRGYLKLGMSDALNAFLIAQNPWVNLNGDGAAELAERHPGLASTAMHGFVHYADLVDALGYVEAKKIIDFRELMQRTGTEAGREVLYENVWVDAVARRVREAQQDVVITGIRFPNELEMVKNLGGHSIWVDRLTDDIAHVKAATPVAWSPEAVSHASESSVKPEDFDFILSNDADLDTLRDRTLLLDSITARR